jgi:hypothetical protein
MEVVLRWLNHHTTLAAMLAFPASDDPSKITRERATAADMASQGRATAGPDHNGPVAVEVLYLRNQEAAIADVHNMT